MLAAYREETPVSRLLGPKPAAALAKTKDVHTLGDLLEYLPRRYLTPHELTELSGLREGDEVMVVAEVSRVAVHRMRERRGSRVAAVITDGHDEIDVTFFTKGTWDFGVRAGRRGIFTGTVSSFRQRQQLTHPQVEWLDRSEEDDAERLAHLLSHLIPVYPTTGQLTSHKIRAAIAAALDTVEPILEPLPAQIRSRRGLLGRRAALELAHRPALTDDVGPARRRFRYDEAFVLQTILAQRRRAVELAGGTPRMPRPDGLLAAFDARLPFELTAGQREVGQVIEAELARAHPMHRLLQGEVGSGKTVVALRAMLTVVDAGGQAALLAPTEVLAAQHHRTITTMLGPLALDGMHGGLLGEPTLGTQVALLTGSQSSKARRRALDAVVTGDAGIVVGTHALIQKHVRFFDLALVVVDEQHRFGVEQRDALRDKAKTPPHLLVMTATPIPRTVAMTVFGDMETATLTELPAGRRPIQTFTVEALRPGWVDRMWTRLGEEVAKGHQVYVVCPSIGRPPDGSELTTDTSDEEAEDLGTAGRAPASVYETAEQLRAHPALTQTRIGVLHGRLPADTKTEVMDAFTRGDIDVLVATTVIEVGVDVPNASTMVVMDADRFGISQLHQLRGRVGRGSAQGLCLLVGAAPTPQAQERLGAVAETTDGFELARRDLQLRREGDVLGARQSGRGSSVRYLRMGNAGDEQLIADARVDATELVATDPTLANHPVLAARVAARLDEQQAAYLERG
jgi:ATP-dependent DNA helicase RecG